MQDTFDFRGDHFRLADSPGLPKPVQASGPPVIVGGSGKRRTPALAARFAAEFNAPFTSVDAAHRLFARVRGACEEAGRPAEDLILSVALTLCVGRDEQELDLRAARAGRELADLREDGLAGTPEEVVERLSAYAATGCTRVYLQVLDLADLDQLELVAAEVLPHV